MDSFLCLKNSTTYQQIPIKEDKIEELKYNFEVYRPYPYKTRTVLGCSADNVNIYCSFFQPSSNTSSIISINNVNPYPFQGEYSAGVLPVPELSLVACSLENRTVAFYDLDHGGLFLGSFQHTSKERLYAPVFSNSTFIMSWQISPYNVTMLKFKPRYIRNACPYYDYTSDYCEYCLDGYQLTKEHNGCIPVNSTFVPVPIPSERILLPPMRWNIKKITPLTHLRLNLTVNFTKDFREQIFYNDFDLEKQLNCTLVGSTESYTDYFDVTSTNNINYIILDFNFKKSMDNQIFDCKLWDSIRNLNYNDYPKSALGTSSETEFSNKPHFNKTHRNFQENDANDDALSNIYYQNLQIKHIKSKRVPLQAVIIPIESVGILNFLFFYICRTIELILIIILLIRPFISALTKNIPLLWLHQTVSLYQVLGHCFLISTYFYRWFDLFLANIGKLYIPGPLGLYTSTISSQIPTWKQNSIYMDKLSDYKLENLWAVLMFKFELIIYFLILIISLITGVFKIAKSFSSLRQSFGLCIFVPLAIWSSFNIYKFQYDLKENNSWYSYGNAWIGGLTCLIITADTILSFNSPKFTDKTILSFLFPKENTSFYSMGSLIFESKQSVSYRQVPTRITAFLNIFKWHSFIAILVIFHNKMILQSVLFLIWAIFYLLLEILLLLSLSFQNLIYACLRIAISACFVWFTFLVFVCSYDYVYDKLPFFLVKLLAILLLISYITLWFLVCLYSFYILIEFITTIKCNIGEKDDTQIRKNYLTYIPQVEEERELSISNFNESNHEKLLREKIKEMTPYQFWTFMKVNKSQMDKQTLYYQALSYCETHVKDKLVSDQEDVEQGRRKNREGEGDINRIYEAVYEEDIEDDDDEGVDILEADKLSALLCASQSKAKNLNHSLKKQRMQRKGFTKEKERVIKEVDERSPPKMKILPNFGQPYANDEIIDKQFIQNHSNERHIVRKQLEYNTPPKMKIDQMAINRVNEQNEDNITVHYVQDSKYSSGNKGPINRYFNQSSSNPNWKKLDNPNQKAVLAPNPFEEEDPDQESSPLKGLHQKQNIKGVCESAELTLEENKGINRSQVTKHKLFVTGRGTKKDDTWMPRIQIHKQEKVNSRSFSFSSEGSGPAGSGECKDLQNDESPVKKYMGDKNTPSKQKVEMGVFRTDKRDIDWVEKQNLFESMNQKEIDADLMASGYFK